MDYYQLVFLNEPFGKSTISHLKDNETIEKILADRSVTAEITDLICENLRLRSRLNYLSKENASLHIATADSVRQQHHFEGMLKCSKDDISKFMLIVVRNLGPETAAAFETKCLPSFLIFMLLRFADSGRDEQMFRNICQQCLESLSFVVKKNSDNLESVIMWLSYMIKLLQLLRQYCGKEPEYQLQNTPKQNGHCLLYTDASDFARNLRFEIGNAIEILKHQLTKLFEPIIVAATFESGALSAFVPNTSVAAAQKTGGCEQLFQAMGFVYNQCDRFGLDYPVLENLFKMILSWVSTKSLNELLFRRDLCTWAKGFEILYNVNTIEAWLKDRNLASAAAELIPIRQACQLLATSKTVDTVCEIATKLTSAQITKILSSYTGEEEERCSPEFMKELVTQLKLCRADTPEQKAVIQQASIVQFFPFTYVPTQESLDAIEIPYSLPLNFVKLQ